MMKIPPWSHGRAPRRQVALRNFRVNSRLCGGEEVFPKAGATLLAGGRPSRLGKNLPRQSRLLGLDYACCSNRQKMLALTWACCQLETGRSAAASVALASDTAQPVGECRILVSRPHVWSWDQKEWGPAEWSKSASAVLRAVVVRLLPTPANKRKA